MPQADPQTLRAEAKVLGRFILHRAVEEEFVERYVTAHEHLFTGPASPGDAAILSFAIRHPVVLPCLDAGAALIRPRTLLHAKALLMAAILEASPRYASEFLPRDVGGMALAWRFMVVGVFTAFQVAVGVPLLVILERRA